MIGGCSVLLDGSNDYVNLGTVAARNFTSSDFSLLAWIFPFSISGYHGILQHGTYNVAGYQLYLDPAAKLYFYTSQAAASQSTTSVAGSVVANRWNHAAIVREAAAVRLYVDGDHATDAPANHLNPASHAGATEVGRGFGGGDAFNGAIDEPAFFNVALTQQQIREYMRLSIPASAPGLVSLHHFDDGLSNFASTTAVAAVSGVNGTLQNGASWVYDRWAPWVEPRISASGGLAVSSSTAALVPGTLRNFIPRVACRPLIASQWDFSLTTAGAGAILGEIQENGAAIAGAVRLAEPAGAVLARGSHFGLATREWSAETLYALRMVGRLSAGGDAIRGTFNTPNTGYSIVAQPIDGTW